MLSAVVFPYSGHILFIKLDNEGMVSKILCFMYIILAPTSLGFLN